MSESRIIKPAAASGEFVEIYGEIYEVLTIGNRKWLQKNLIANDDLDGIITDPAYTDYGLYYRYYAAERIVATIPDFRIPSYADAMDLVNAATAHYGGYGAVKEEGFDHWNSPNTGAQNAYNFALLGAGMYNGSFPPYNFKNDGTFLTSYNQPSRYIYLLYAAHSSATIWGWVTGRSTASGPLRLVKDI